MRCPVEQGEQELLFEFCSGTLDTDRAASLRDHIAGCPACRELEARQRTLWQALDNWEAPPVSAGFDHALYGRIRNEVTWWDLALRPFRPLFARQGLAVAVAACLTIIVGVLIERPAAVPAGAVPESAQVEIASPDQVERALDDMEMLREFNHLVPADAGGPKM